MIPQQPARVHTIDVTECASDAPELTWQQQLADIIRTPEDLLAYLQLPSSLLNDAQRAADAFALRIPKAFANRMIKGDVNDPLLRQVLPLGEELAPPPAGYSLDPLGEVNANAQPGVVHKYRSRVLLIVNSACAVHCRYCFRRHFPYGDNQLGLQQWQESLAYVKQQPQVNEIILSGGDPLSSNDTRLFKLLDMIEALPQITRVRIHSRLPVVIPARLTDALIARLAQSRLKVVLVIHANHQQELDTEVALVLNKARQAGLHLPNQAVLLKGVNDTLSDQVALSERLFELGVLPYYLHLLDPVVGAHHFDIPLQQAQQLHHDMQLALPGFLVPKLVRELAEHGSKTPIAPLVAPN